jgi:hypothetical protein
VRGVVNVIEEASFKKPVYRFSTGCAQVKWVAEFAVCLCKAPWRPPCMILATITRARDRCILATVSNTLAESASSPQCSSHRTWRRRNEPHWEVAGRHMCLFKAYTTVLHKVAAQLSSTD